LLLQSPAYTARRALERINQTGRGVVPAQGNDGKKMIWKNQLEKLSAYFERQFGADWKEKDDFFKKFEEEISEIKKA
jgi:hypothetical protein